MLEREQQAALEVIRLAGNEVMRLYRSFEKIEDAPADISTDADRASQRIILQYLKERFPDDGLCGEESTPGLEQNSTSGRLWIVDPIDGTRGFARKNDEFSLMIGLVQDGQPILGVVYEPAIDRVTYACQGSGCFWRQPFDSEPKKATVTTTAIMSDAVLSISRSQGQEGEQRLLEGLGAGRAVQTYSAGIKFAQVARGETDVYLGDYLTLKDWDVCAGHALLIEAGGTVTNIHGEPIQYDGSGKSLQGQGIVGTNGPLHQQVLDALSAGRYVFKK